MNSKLENIKKIFNDYAESVLPKDKETDFEKLVPYITEFMYKHDNDIVNILYVRASVKSICKSLNVRLDRLAVSGLSLEHYPTYRLGLGDENIFFEYTQPTEWYATVSISFCFTQNDNIIIKINQFGVCNTFQFVWNTKSKTIIERLVVAHNITSDKKQKELHKHTIQTIDFFNRHFDEFIDKFEEKTNHTIQQLNSNRKGTLS